MDRITFRVVDENKLGYVHPELPGFLQVIATSPLRGAGSYPIYQIALNEGEGRLAVREDFDAFRVSYEGYERHPERYAPLDTDPRSVASAVAFLERFFPEYLAAV